MKLITTLLLAMLLASPSAVRAGDETRTTTGHGRSLPEAISQACAEAVAQVKGLKIKSVRGHELHYNENYKEISNGIAKFANTSATLTTGSIFQETGGLVRTYKILNQSQDSKSGEFTVEVEASIPVYDPNNPRPGSKRTIAIVDFRLPHTSFSFGGVSVSASDVNRKFSSRLTDHITQSRRFLTLDRTYVAELAAEHAVIASGQAPISEMVKLGEVLGADYLVVGTIEEISLTEQEKYLVASKRTVKLQDGRYSVAFRVINVGTKRIHWSDTLTEQFDRNFFRRPPERLAGLRLDDVMIELAATDVANNVLETVYPVQVMRAAKSKTYRTPEGKSETGFEIVLNQGGVRMNIGDRFTVMSKGEELVDPATGDVSFEEEEIAVVVVTRASKKSSRARVVSGNPNDIEYGNVCRRAKD